VLDGVLENQLHLRVFFRLNTSKSQARLENLSRKMIVSDEASITEWIQIKPIYRQETNELDNHSIFTESLRVHSGMLASLFLEQCLSQFVFSSLRLLVVNTPRLASGIFYSLPISVRL
jgi:hypothetical protein